MGICKGYGDVRNKKVVGMERGKGLTQGSLVVQEPELRLPRARLQSP